MIQFWLGKNEVLKEQRKKKNVEAQFAHKLKRLVEGLLDSKIFLLRLLHKVQHPKGNKIGVHPKSDRVWIVCNLSSTQVKIIKLKLKLIDLLEVELEFDFDLPSSPLKSNRSYLIKN